MNEQAFNIKFVGEVEKYPVLYNYKLKEYSRRDVTEKAWNEVAKIVNLSVAECKEKWKNLRSVFVRRLKPPPSGSGNKTKPYYLSEAMQFTLPYIRTVGKPEGNLPEGANVPPPTSVVSQQLSEDTSQQHHLSEDEEDSSFTNNSTEVPPPPPYLFESQTSHNKSASSHPIEPHCTPSTTDSVSTPVFKKKRKQDTFTDVDKSFKDYMDAKRRKLETQATDSQAKKQFLDSLLPEIEPLTEQQMRGFRRRVLLLIDEIRFPQDQYQLGLGDTRITSPILYSSSSCSSAMPAESHGIHTATMEEEGQTTSQQYYEELRKALDPSN